VRGSCCGGICSPRGLPPSSTATGPTTPMARSTRHDRTFALGTRSECIYDFKSSLDALLKQYELLIALPSLRLLGGDHGPVE
jgi:hypothetical protein